MKSGVQYSKSTNSSDVWKLAQRHFNGAPLSSPVNCFNDVIIARFPFVVLNKHKPFPCSS